MYCLYRSQYKSKRVYVPKSTNFSDYWLRTSAVIHVYKGRARRNGYRMFISVYILCYIVDFIFLSFGIMAFIVELRNCLRVTDEA